MTDLIQSVVLLILASVQIIHFLLLHRHPKGPDIDPLARHNHHGQQTSHTIVDFEQAVTRIIKDQWRQG